MQCWSECVCVSVCGFMTDTLCPSLPKRHSASMWKHRQCEAGASQEERKSHPVFVHSVSLLSSCSEHNTTRCPLQFIAAFLMRSVAAWNFKACCRVTFFSEAVLCKGKGFFSKPGSLIYFDNSDMHSCKKILIAQSRSLYSCLIKWNTSADWVLNDEHQEIIIFCRRDR